MGKKQDIVNLAGAIVECDNYGPLNSFTAEIWKLLQEEKEQGNVTKGYFTEEECVQLTDAYKKLGDIEKFYPSFIYAIERSGYDSERLQQLNAAFAENIKAEISLANEISQWLNNTTSVSEIESLIESFELQELLSEKQRVLLDHAKRLLRFGHRKE